MMSQLVKELISSDVLKSPQIIQAFLHVDRIDFVPKSMKENAYADEPLPIGHGQTISQPWTVAFMLELLEPKQGEKILDVGSGSGWQTGLLSYIVSHDHLGNKLDDKDCGKVIGIEIIPELAKMGINNLLAYDFIKTNIAEIHCLNANAGFEQEVPFDKIIAAASGNEVPNAWKEQVKIKGRIVVPVDSHIALLVKEDEKNFSEKRFEGFAFVPFVG